ncbi:MAG: hypothetical protein PUG20_01985 [Chlamydia suis]|uniref:hypothetical protein n=1 Tax=Chlamydia suis TaxID=83559 RepID=UPI0015D75956|nr:hypothetical protein [Chlamydia suis]MDD7385762.1 hypothetical protein [Chlamydia suis]MDY4960633.1 hypothetical protein [Chlamydia suis]
MFISFDKTLASEHGPDTAESIGNLLSYPVNRGFSSLVAVKTLGHKSDPFFSIKIVSICTRICCIIATILLAPIILLMALAGIIAYNYSTSYQQTKALFSDWLRNSVKTFEMFQEQTKPIITLQKRLKGYLIRKPLLNRALFSEYKTVCEKINSGLLDNIDCINRDEQLSYIAKELPSLIFKKVGAQQAKQRIQQNIALNACLANAAVKNIQVLPANAYKDFLVEQKAFGQGPLDTLITYQVRPQSFNDIVKDLVKLFQTYYFPELFYEPKHLLRDLPYNHLLLNFQQPSFKACGAAKFSSILKKSDPRTNPRLYLTGISEIRKQPTPNLVEKLIFLFPQHEDLICEEAVKYRIPIPTKEVVALLQEQGNLAQIRVTGNIDDSIRYLTQEHSGFNNFIGTWPTSGIYFAPQKEELVDWLEDLNKNPSLTSRPRKFFRKGFLYSLTGGAIKNWDYTLLVQKMVGLICSDLRKAIEAHHTMMSPFVNSFGSLLESRAPVLSKKDILASAVKFVKARFATYVDERINFEQQGKPLPYDPRDDFASLEEIQNPEFVNGFSLEFTEEFLWKMLDIFMKTEWIERYDRMEDFDNGEFFRIIL